MPVVVSISVSRLSAILTASAFIECRASWAQRAILQVLRWTRRSPNIGGLSPNARTREGDGGDNWEAWSVAKKHKKEEWSRPTDG